MGPAAGVAAIASMLTPAFGMLFATSVSTLVSLALLVAVQVGKDAYCQRYKSLPDRKPTSRRKKGSERASVRRQG
jgi:hypothetical protein